MKFVNITRSSVYTPFFGTLAPGAVSSGNGKKCRVLEDALTEIVKACGNKLGIRLNAEEAKLLKRLMDLDELGGGFDPTTIPAEIRNDPTGAKRAEEAARAMQQSQIDKDKAENVAGARREAEINGEILPPRKPVGPATMEGEKVDPTKIKSGFEAIMEENARIASGEKKPEMDVDEALDPIGAHAAGAPKKEVPDSEDAIGRNPEPVVEAKGVQGDVTRNADAEMPKPEAPERGNAMDRQAADIAGKLATMGPVEEPPANDAKAAKGAKKGRGRKNK